MQRKHNLFRLKQTGTVIQNRITVPVCFNTRELTTMLCPTLNFEKLTNGI